jgi:hypothetical protein
MCINALQAAAAERELSTKKEKNWRNKSSETARGSSTWQVLESVTCAIRDGFFFNSFPSTKRDFF